MIRLAWKNLAQEPMRLVISVGGVALAIVLILVMQGVWAGSEEHAVAYMRNQPADLWVMQEGVENMHMATSILPAGVMDEIREVEAVKQAVAVLYANVGVDLGETTVFSYVFGVQPDDPFGGPWLLVEGHAPREAADIVIDVVLARRHGLGLGDQVRILDRNFYISGLSKGNLGIATSLVFVRKASLAEMLGLPPGVSSYILVQSAAGADRAKLERQLDSIEAAHALQREAFIASDQLMIRSMGIDVVRAMKSVAYVVGLLVIGLTLYTATLERKREYGILRAVGGSLRHLWAVVLAQALISALLGILFGVALAFAVAWLISTALPEMLVLVYFTDVLSVMWTLLMVSILAALLPAVQVGRLDPMMVFRGHDG